MVYHRLVDHVSDRGVVFTDSHQLFYHDSFAQNEIHQLRLVVDQCESQRIPLASRVDLAARCKHDEGLMGSLVSSVLGKINYFILLYYLDELVFILVCEPAPPNGTSQWETS